MARTEQEIACARANLTIELGGIAEHADNVAKQMSTIPHKKGSASVVICRSFILIPSFMKMTALSLAG